MDVEGIRSTAADVKVEDEGISDDVRRGPWTAEEDFKLINYIATHGEGRWNSLARSAGLKRTGKSCRLRWLNYLRPDVRRGNITLQEQLLILELHSRWGNRWSKIAQFLPGRTDNEIKNYWRTRVQKHAKQLKCDVNSKQFKDTVRYLWMPRLVERIQAAAATSTSTASASSAAAAVSSAHQFIDDVRTQTVQPQVGVTQVSTHGYSYTPESSNTATSSDSFVAQQQVSPVSDLADYYHVPMMNNLDADHRCFQTAGEPLVSPCGFYNGGSSSEYFGLDVDQQNNNSWFGGEDGGEQSLWNGADDFWFLQQQLMYNL